tara:strand:+ start:6483 stop:7478 length:996 start_codon:yes stop_codon:yes gene_type:complete
MKKIYLITNDKIWFSGKRYTSNNDLNNIITSLNNDYNVNLICRKSSKELNFELTENFNHFDLAKINDKSLDVMLISITPYNFFILFYLLLVKRINIRGFVYLRSDGFLEYKYRYGFIGYFIYLIMFSLIKKKLKILSCSKYFTNVEVKNILHPSELDHRWRNRQKIETKSETDFLYVGRFKRDKGAYYLADIFKNLLKEYKLIILGNDKKFIPKKYFANNIYYKTSTSDLSELIQIYDSAKIFILPSYIEGFPKVISESLARLRPVIIFDEIKYVIHERDGIFVSERNEESLRKTINHIFKNYVEIQEKIKKNYFYTKDNFKKELLEAINI